MLIAFFGTLFSPEKNSWFVTNSGCFDIGLVLAFTLKSMNPIKNHHKYIKDENLKHSNPEKFVGSLCLRKCKSESNLSFERCKKKGLPSLQISKSKHIPAFSYSRSAAFLSSRLWRWHCVLFSTWRHGRGRIATIPRIWKVSWCENLSKICLLQYICQYSNQLISWFSPFSPLVNLCSESRTDTWHWET